MEFLSRVADFHTIVRNRAKEITAYFILLLLMFGAKGYQVNPLNNSSNTNTQIGLLNTHQHF